MMGITHAMFALLLVLVGHVPNDTFMIWFLLLGALFPDIDTTRSGMGKRLKPLSNILQYMGHRGFLHSLMGMFFSGSLLWILVLILGIQTSLMPFFLGYSSHLFLDALTPKGINILFPLKTKIKGPIRTDSISERILFTLFLLLAVYVVYF